MRAKETFGKSMMQTLELLWLAKKTHLGMKRC